jgi:hypothetical protein
MSLGIPPRGKVTSAYPRLFGDFYFYFWLFGFFFPQLNCGGRLIGWGEGPYREARFDSSVAL